MLTRILALAAAALLLGCPDDPKPEPDAGVNVEDSCNSAETAGATADCLLAVGAERQGYVFPKSDADWYVLDLADPLPPRALLTVKATYKVPSTPVRLTVNLLKADAKSSLGYARDQRLRGVAGPAQITARVYPPVGPGAGRYYIIVSHDGAAQPAADEKNPYFLTASLASDPDSAEPNDSKETATAVSLPACSGDSGGAATLQGALAMSGDKDFFSFNVSPCTGRTILHARFVAPASAADIRLAYEIRDSTDKVVGEGHAASPAVEQRVISARLVTAGQHTLILKPYQEDPNIVPPGDPAFTYTGTLQLFRDLDTNEPTNSNDTPATATSINVAQGSTQTMNGRLSYLGDVDYFAVNTSGAQRIWYRLQFRNPQPSNAGRYEGTGTVAAHELNVFNTLSSGCAANCPGSDAALKQAWCNQSPPHCLRQRRLEDSRYEDLRNFEGQLQAPGGGGPWYIQVGYQGGAGADDREYSLSVKVLAETADETASSPRSFSVPVNGTTVIGHGLGWHSGPQAPNSLSDIPYGNNDYDGEDDRDMWLVQFTPPPAPPQEIPDGGTPDPTWPVTADQALIISWQIPPAAGQAAGQRSHDLRVRFHLCADQACSSERPTPTFGFESDTSDPWYAGMADAGIPANLERQKPWQFDQNSGTFSPTPVMCTCLDEKFARAGRFKVELIGYHRTSYDDANVRLQLSLGTYPPTVTDDQGNTFTCPVPCNFMGSAVGN